MQALLHATQQELGEDTLVRHMQEDVIGMSVCSMARDAVESGSWSHPAEPITEEWWADVLADPRARRRE
jgi:hypothetical protein